MAKFPCSSAGVPAQMTIMYSNPVLCAMLGWVLRGERVGLVGALGIMVTMLGVVFVAQPPVIFGGHEWSHTRMAGMLNLQVA
jgi:drug/metabolite transporter (DMT)-like permease